MGSEKSFIIAVSLEGRNNALENQGEPLECFDMLTGNLRVSGDILFEVWIESRQTVIASFRGPHIGEPMAPLVCTTTSITLSNRFRGWRMGFMISRTLVIPRRREELIIIDMQSSALAGTLKEAC
jgi:hypothetical protein